MDRTPDTQPHLLAGRPLADWEREHPVISEIAAARPTIWLNEPALTTPASVGLASVGLTRADIDDADARLRRFAPYLAAVFPQTASSAADWGTPGIIESPLAALPGTSAALADGPVGSLDLWGKLDSHLPISGSIKARGGIYEVLVHAEQLALEHGILTSTDDDYSILAGDDARALFARHRIAVGSTGNLGLSIGIMSAQLGFAVSVHMSADARAWKKDMLRSHGVEVVEYDADYSVAVAEARAQAAGDDSLYFVDDENSRSLFLGYAVAGRRLAAQLRREGRTPTQAEPLVVHLPCGVGGGPGGVAFGLKTEFGDAVRCIFVEPVQSPSMLLGVLTGAHEEISVRDIGLTNVTVADGLACASPSGFVGAAVEKLVDAFVTVGDDAMFRRLAQLSEADGIRVEPSSAAALDSAARIAAGRGAGLNLPTDAMHLAWLTGGSMVPEQEMDAYVQRGCRVPH